MAVKSKKTELILEANKLGIVVKATDNEALIMEKIIAKKQEIEKEDEKLRTDAFFMAEDLIRVPVTQDEVKELERKCILMGFDNTKGEKITPEKPDSPQRIVGEAIIRRKDNPAKQGVDISTLAKPR